MITLAAWYHDLNPFIWRISGDVGIRWYGVSYLAGFLVAFLILRWLSNRGYAAVPRDRISDAMMWLIGGTIVGGRLVYVLIYDRHLLSEFSPSFPFWAVFAINKGGMASHGGIIGVIVAAMRVSRGWRMPDGSIAGRCSVWHIFDVMALMCPLGLGFGRLANFVNGELLGRVYSPPGVEGPWWTVQFARELTERPEEITSQRAAQLRPLVEQIAPGVPFDRGLPVLVDHAVALKDQLKPLLSSRHPSQLYQAAAEGPVLFAMLWLIWWRIGRPRARHDGLIGAAFMIGYGLLRVLTEFWRLPDSQFGASGHIYGLSRGQWLSVAMVVIGIVAVGMRLRTSSRPSA